MSFLDAARYRLRALFRPGAADREREEEFALHNSLAEADHAHATGDTSDAPHAARRDFGNVTYMKEETRWTGPMRWLDPIGQDVRYGWRALRRSPVFLIVAVLSLGIGTGANAVIFGAIHSLVLTKVGVPNADELRILLNAPDGVLRAFFSPSEEVALRAARGGELASFRAQRVRGAEVNGVPLADPVVDAVDGPFFKVLDVRAAAGRLFDESESRDGVPIAVVSHRFATAHFVTPAAAIGKTVKIDGAPFTIIGVTRPEYEGLSFGASYTMAVPATALAAGRARDNRGPGTFLVTRMRRDSAQVRASLEAVFNACCANGELAGGATSGNRRLGFLDISHGVNEGKKVDVRARYSNPLLALMAGVAVLLLIACTNVGNLLMARATARSREIAVRLSLGASRGRLVRQLFVEALLLAGCGGLAGLLLALWGSALLSRNLPVGMENLGPFLTLRMGAPVLWFTAAVAFACALVFGVVPALRATRRGVAAGLRDDRGARRTPRIERGIVALQVGLALVLMSSAGLLVATLKHLAESVGGSNPETLLVVQLDARGTPHSDTALHLAVPTLKARFEAIPGVQSVAESYVVPLIYGGLPTNVLDLAGFEQLDDAQAEVAAFPVSPGYFATLGVNVIAGRDFNERDVIGTQRVVVISENLAQQFFPGRNPVGEVIGFRGAGRGLQIVGVVGDAKQTDLRSPAPRTVYLASAQATDFGDRAVFAVRTTADPTIVIPAARAAILAELPRIGIRHLHPMSDLLSITVARERTMAVLSIAFGLLAVLLAAIGLYGVMAFQVSARTREIGVRMALGASQTQVIRMVLGQALALVAIGVAVGVPLAFVGARSLRALLYGVTPFDPLPLAIGAAVLVAVGTIASLVPSRSAARVDPLIAIRAD
ncbi:MAG TPA: ADOP family duplicated permease [Gemmatimonadaceae bacterium]|nr:ADOP family duplicated permease [Gemmatimonadaceae bacterium]